MRPDDHDDGGRKPNCETVDPAAHCVRRPPDTVHSDSEQPLNTPNPTDNCEQSEAIQFHLRYWIAALRSQ